GKRFLDLRPFNDQPLVRDLAGLEVEYRVLQLYCRDAGRKEATLTFHVFRDGEKEPAASAKPLPVVFESTPAVLVKLRVRDHDGKARRDGRPVVAAFTFTDAQGRVYPAPSRRLAPDFNFHFQVYRGDGDAIALQPGSYTATWTRGPEYLVQRRTFTVPPAPTHTEALHLKRCVHPPP